MASRKGSYTYNPQTGQWNKSGGNSTTSTTTTKPKNNEKKNTGSSNSSKPSSNSKKSGDNLSSSSTGKKSSGGKTEKKSNYIEFNTLSGTLNYIVNERTIKIRAGDTIKLAGLGKYLSGKYYVKDVTRQISSDGYSNSATLIKTDMGASLKKKKKTTPKKGAKKISQSFGATNEYFARKEKNDYDNAKCDRTHITRKGESVWNIAKKYYGDGSLYPRILDANPEIQSDLKVKVGQTLIIP